MTLLYGVMAGLGAIHANPRQLTPRLTRLFSTISLRCDSDDDRPNYEQTCEQLLLQDHLPNCRGIGTGCAADQPDCRVAQER